jgi:hypothetical protein
MEKANVSLKDVKQAIKAHQAYSAAAKIYATAEAAKKAAAMIVFEALLGVTSESEVASLSPSELVKLARRRIREGLVEFADMDDEQVQSLLSHVIQKSQSRRNVSWKDAFVSELGAAAALKVTDETPESFSYKFVAGVL